MIASNGIRVENVYYMLAYAFKALGEGVYARVKGEAFENAEDLFGAILSCGMQSLYKRGLYSAYLEEEEDLPCLRGKVDIPGTVRHYVNRRKMLHCAHDEFSVDNLYNRILKTTAAQLLRSGNLDKSLSALKSALLCFSNVSEVPLSSFRWSQLRYQRSNQHYLMLMNICRFVLDGLIMSDGIRDEGRLIRHVQYDEERLSHLYEAFLREYFVRHYKLGASAKAIDWAMDECGDARNINQLPSMRSDVVLANAKTKLIIDAKFYKTSMQTYWGHESVNSANFYQLFAYVTNEQNQDRQREVSGMLLYAKTEEEEVPDLRVTIAGNSYEARVLDLARPFAEISRQLDGIAKEYFGDINKES